MGFSASSVVLRHRNQPKIQVSAKASLRLFPARNHFSALPVKTAAEFMNRTPH
jgi:hypothetical protein